MDYGLWIEEVIQFLTWVRIVVCAGAGAGAGAGRNVGIVVGRLPCLLALVLL
jgi:hypothetical protein